MAMVLEMDARDEAGVAQAVPSRCPAMEMAFHCLITSLGSAVRIEVVIPKVLTVTT
jgi:hypothetical protein